jgi:putative phosphoribosyl transferase
MRLPRLFTDRADAGRALAGRLVKRRLADPVILALPRGGVPVAAEIARALRAPLDLVLVRKIGVPDQPELAAAAVVDGGAPELVVNADVAELAGIGDTYIRERMTIELAEIERRRSVYLAGRSRLPLDGRVVIVVDDGIATGASIRAAITALRRKRPKLLIVAVPVAPQEAINELRGTADEVICLERPEPFHAIGAHYRDFHQISDEEVVRLLRSVDAQFHSERHKQAPANSADSAGAAEGGTEAQGAKPNKP